MQLLATLFNPLQSLVFSDTIPLLCQRSEDTSCRISQTECNLGKTRSSFHSGPLCSGYCGIEEAGGHPHGPPFILGPDTRCVCSPAPRPALLCGGILQSQAPSLSTLSLLFQDKLTLRLCLHFLSTHGPLQISCDSKHSPPR